MSSSSKNVSSAGQKRSESDGNIAGVANSHHHGTREVLCFISEADGRVNSLEIDAKALGQDLMNKVSKSLGFLEECDYFGLQYQVIHKKKDMFFWLNLRNRIDHQLQGLHSPYHMYLRVKFFVPPHRLLLDETRAQFYKNVVHNLATGLWDQSMVGLEMQASFIAMMTQVNFGNYNASTSSSKYSAYWPETKGPISTELEAEIAKQHQTLTNISRTTLQYDLLQRVAEHLTWYGVYFYTVKDYWGKPLFLGVGPTGVLLRNSLTDEDDKTLYTYQRIQKVTVSDRVLFLGLLEADYNIRPHGFRLSNRQCANALYRYLTEAHCFYHCTSVAEDVLRQTTTHLWNRLAARILPSRYHNQSPQSPHSTGRRHSNTEGDFMFDVMHTAREVHDRARRRLHHSAARLTGLIMERASSPCILENAHSQQVQHSHSPLCRHHTYPTCSAQKDSPISEKSDDVETLRNQLQQLRAAVQCCVCLSAPIERVFYPCGHPVCCGECSDIVQQCPYCRQNIEQRLHFYMTLPSLQVPSSRRNQHAASSCCSTSNLITLGYHQSSSHGSSSGSTSSMNYFAPSISVTLGTGEERFQAAAPPQAFIIPPDQKQDEASPIIADILTFIETAAQISKSSSGYEIRDTVSVIP